MADDAWFHRRFEIQKWLGFLALVGAAVGVAALVLGKREGIVIVAAIISIVPVIVYWFVLPIWHWKERYVGNHSDLWGFLLLVETSSWSRIVYWFRHILADWQGKGRYRSASEPDDSNAKPAV